jgi:ATP dependent DNA ligase domain
MIGPTAFPQLLKPRGGFGRVKWSSTVKRSYGDERDFRDFQSLRRELSRKGSNRIVYLAFDLLYLDGRDLRQEPYLKRKRELQALLTDASENLSYVEYLEGDGHEALRHANTCDCPHQDGCDRIINSRIRDL